jgi:circadian clock protein KaiC
MPEPAKTAPDRLPTGVAGLDDVLQGGLPPRRLYLVHGDPGAGKTTLALQFLLEGARRGEPVLFVSLSENAEELHAVAASHRWSLDGVRILEIASDERPEDSETTLYHPSEIELGQRMRTILDELDRLRPTRVALDSCSDLRLLAQTPLRYRRQILALKSRVAQWDCTMFLIDAPHPDADMLLQSVVHGVVVLEQLAPEFGAERRRLRIQKLRALKYRGGYHDFAIRTGGLVVFPRLVAAEYRHAAQGGMFSSGVAELDQILGGGPERGTSLLVIGPSGAGKSSIATLYAKAAGDRGENAAVFAFDESRTMFLARARSLGTGVDAHVDAGRIALKQIDPAELSPGEFTHLVRTTVEANDARVVLVDSLNGYLNAMPEEKFAQLQLHELLTYLAHRGSLTIVTLAQHGLISETSAPIDVTYLADTVLLLRYFEASGQVRKAISVVKKRSGPHEATIRELLSGAEGVRLGPPLTEFQGVLSGSPENVGRSGAAG